jgi:LysM repeat protein
MKKLLLLVLLYGSFNLCAKGQEAKYSIHAIAKGETLSALAQHYHTTIGDIMRLNGMNAKSRLTIGEKIKIPSGDSKTISANTKTVSANTEPVSANTKPVSPNTKTVPPGTKTSSAPDRDSSVATHYVLHGETLYSISKKFGVTIDQLKEWNNLPNETIHFGQQLAVSSEGTAMIALKKETQQTIETQQTDTKNTLTKNTIDTINNEKENSDTSKQLIAKAVSVDVMPANPVPVQEASSKDISNGYFAKDFPESNNLKHISGDAMTFKTNSGWTDSKYYVLTNEAPSGSIVRVTALTGKSVYAKVLWKLEDMKLNEGLTFRISDAAASVLGITDQKFRVTVQYQ